MTPVDHIYLTLESSDSEGHLIRPCIFTSQSSSPHLSQCAETTTARFDLDPFAGCPPAANIHRGTICRPISPPQLKRPAAGNTSQGGNTSFEPVRSVPAVARAGSKTTPTKSGFDNATDMARLSGVGPTNPPLRQVTPPLERHSPKSGQQTKATPPKYQTPRKPEWDVAGIARTLTTFRQDIKDGHARMTSYIIESTKATERRVHTGHDLFAGLVSKPVPAQKGETMRIRFKVMALHPLRGRWILMSLYRSTPR